MTLSARLLAERLFVETELGDVEICGHCRATLRTYINACTADLSEMCPGFIVIETAKEKFRADAAAVKGKT